MSTIDSALVSKVWNYAHVLRDQGIGYGDYVEQITFLLFLKMDQERNDLLGESSAIPAKWRWDKLAPLAGDELEAQYRHTLEALGREKGLIGAIFRGAQNKLTDPAKLKRVVSLIDAETWTILLVNDAWKRSVMGNGYGNLGPGSNYYDEVDRLAAGGHVSAGMILPALKEIRQGRRTSFRLVYDGIRRRMLEERLADPASERDMTRFFQVVLMEHPARERVDDVVLRHVHGRQLRHPFEQQGGDDARHRMHLRQLDGQHLVQAVRRAVQRQLRHLHVAPEHQRMHDLLLREDHQVFVHVRRQRARVGIQIAHVQRRQRLFEQDEHRHVARVLQPQHFVALGVGQGVEVRRAVDPAMLDPLGYALAVDAELPRDHAVQVHGRRVRLRDQAFHPEPAARAERDDGRLPGHHATAGCG